MSLIGERIETDVSYPISVLWGIEAANGELSCADGEVPSFEALGYLFATMEEIRYRTPFHPKRRSGFGCEDGLLHRRGVWRIIDGVLALEPGAATCENEQERAEWFQGIITLTKKQIELRELTARFKEGVAGLGLEVSVVGAFEAVNLVFDPELTGEIAYQTAQRVIEQLVLKLKAFIELDRPRLVA